MLGEFERRLPSVGLDHVVAPLFAFLAQRPAHQALVVDDHDFLGGHWCLIYYEIAFCSAATAETSSAQPARARMPARQPAGWLAPLEGRADAASEAT